MAKLDRLDILVNNAGICHLAKPFADLPLEAWQETLGVNLLGIVNFTRLAIPLLKRQGAGKIVNIASLAGEVGGIATAADYVASKAAVIGLTKSLARELATGLPSPAHLSGRKYYYRLLVLRADNIAFISDITEDFLVISSPKRRLFRFRILSSKSFATTFTSLLTSLIKSNQTQGIEGTERVICYDDWLSG